MEERLSGGNVSATVVRIGDTVRKPWTAASPAVTAVLEHLAARACVGAPRALGRDELGRQVLEFVPGQLSTELPPLSLHELGRLGGLIRTLHDCLADFQAGPGERWDVAVRPDREELICHNDLGPWNLVRDGDWWVFIDWDGAGPGSRLWDLAYAVRAFVPLDATGRPRDQQVRLRATVDGYGLRDDQRADLPALIAGHTRAMWNVLQSGREPWSRLNAEGHGDCWKGSTDYVERHIGDWRQALRVNQD